MDPCIPVLGDDIRRFVYSREKSAETNEKMNFSFPIGPAALHQQIHRILRRARGQADHLLTLDHPMESGVWNADLGVRGWIASDRAVASVRVRVGDGAEDPARLVERPDVAWRLGRLFGHHTGFVSDRTVSGWLGDASAADLSLIVEWGDGSRTERPLRIVSRREERRAKRARYVSCLRCPDCRAELVEAGEGQSCSACSREYPDRHGALDFLSRETAGEFGADETENISGWEYDPKILELIRDRPDGLFLDCGAGLRRADRPNVVHFEIVRYSSTDVVGVAEKLPFADQSFDGVFSVAVLEHVQDPFRCARELMRVLKPGGVLFAAVPFLQPLHGYPHHYYNMTMAGVRRLFPGLDILDQYVPLSLHPMQSLKWMLLHYTRGLPDASRRRFARMTVHEILHSPELRELESHPYPIVHDLKPEQRVELAGGTCLLARKPVG
jgi:SAM-dependent methyltransferase